MDADGEANMAGAGAAAAAAATAGPVLAVVGGAEEAAGAEAERGSDPSELDAPATVSPLPCPLVAVLAVLAVAAAAGA